MITNIDLRMESKAAQRAQKDLYQVLFGTRFIAEYIAIVFVLFSIFLAVFIPYQGLFWTSQSEGMTNFHRWLYDLFVLISMGMGIILYFLVRRKMIQPAVRQQWRLYVQAQANFKMLRMRDAIQQKKKILLKNPSSELIAISFFLIIFILIYTCVTPSESSRRGDFWIQTWWPINAAIIGVLYYSNFRLYIRLFAVKDIHRQYRLITMKED